MDGRENGSWAGYNSDGKVIGWYSGSFKGGSKVSD